MTQASANKAKVSYDTIFVGAGVVTLLEASYQKFLGKNVLVLEKERTPFGAWKSLDLFGHNNVENAVHYLLPNSKALNFLQNDLGLELKKSKSKYRVVNVKYFNFSIFFRFDGLVSRLYSYIQHSGFLFFDLLKILLSSINDRQKNHRSTYFTNGSPDLTRRVGQIAAANDLSIKFNCKLLEVRKFKNGGFLLETTTGAFRTAQIVFGHGMKAPEFFANGKKLILNPKTHYRPSVHLLIDFKDSKRWRTRDEVIFSDHQRIKYAHDVTRFTTHKANGPNRSLRIFVVALQAHTKYSEGICELIHADLKSSRVVPKSADLIDTHWSDIFLPEYTTEDLKEIALFLGSEASFLETENFTDSISKRVDIWKKKSFPCVV